MFPSLSLRNLLVGAISRKDRRPAARNRKSVRLLLESLEERLTPTAPQTAGSYTDLVNAVAADTGTNTNYDIQITQSFQFTSGNQVSIANLGTGSTLTIEGQNGTNYTLTGNGNRLFEVDSGQNVTFKNLTLTGGIVDGSSTGSAHGGGILDSGGTVTLSGVAVQNNEVTEGEAEGGGIYVDSGGTLTVEGGSTISSNSAIDGTESTAHHISNVDYGGGLYVYVPSTITITDSSISNNIAHAGRGFDAPTPGEEGDVGGQARGGGLYVGGLNWNVTLLGDTLAGNSVIGGNGGNGAAGSAATADNTSGGTGGEGGPAQEADGGGGNFSVYSPTGPNNGTGTLTILNDAANPSLIVNNTVQAGSGGTGGAGGASTGTADNSNGGQGGQAGSAFGGGLRFFTFETTMNVTIGNTTIYGNKMLGGNGGTGGAAGTGGSGQDGSAGSEGTGAGASGGGIELDFVNATIVNSTIAANTTTGGSGNGGQQPGSGGGIDEPSSGTVILENNTITQNVMNGTGNFGAGIALDNGDPTLLNNLIQGNQGSGSSGNDVDSYLPTLTNASNNFIGTSSANAFNSTTNIVGNPQTQLGSVVGVDSSGNLTGGPIYYPLLANVVSIGAGATSALNTIATVEGTTTDAATDEIGNPRSSNNAIDIGAIENELPSAPAVTTDPSSQTVMAGNSVSFTASASGNYTPSVQWQVSTDGGSTFTDISGATTATLMLSNVQASQNGYQYRAAFTNGVGTVDSTVATLTVQSAPAISSGNSATFTAGQTGSFTVTATGSPAPTLSESGALPNGVTFTDNGNGTAVLAGAAAAGTQGTYHITITANNGVGSPVSQGFTLTVNPAPTPPPPPPVLNVPPLLGLIRGVFLKETETVNANGTETFSYSFFGFVLITATYDGSGNVVSGTLFGFAVPNWIWG